MSSATPKPLDPTSNEGRKRLSFLAGNAVFAEPIRICNSASREPLTLPQWSVREGGDDHLDHKSRGF